MIFGEGAAWWGALKRFSATFSHAWAWSWWLSARTGGGLGEVPIRGEAWPESLAGGDGDSSRENGKTGRSTYGLHGFHVLKKVGCGTSTEDLLLEENLVLLPRPKPISIR